jgi:hypothetical protein
MKDAMAGYWCGGNGMNKSLEGRQAAKHLLNLNGKATTQETEGRGFNPAVSERRRKGFSP